MAFHRGTAGNPARAYADILEIFCALTSRRTIGRAVQGSTRTVVSQDSCKLCLRDKNLNELYNLKDDPFNPPNLYSDRQFASVISRLAGEIRRWQDP